MKNFRLLILGIALLLSGASSLHAQDDGGLDGCVNSPENPTAILAVVGSAGAFFVSARARIKARSKSKDTN